MAAIHEELVAAIDEVSGGPHPGYRAAHAKGVLCEGSFQASARARELSRAEHLSGKAVPVTARFSNGSGNPALPDNARVEGRGLAVKFHLDGPATDLVSLTLPVFFARNLDEFLAMTRARRPDPKTGYPDPERIGAVIAEHPHIGAAIQLILPALAPPQSYATCTYNSLHAFGLVAGDGPPTWVRLRWSPEAGEHALAEEEIEAAAPDYLRDELRERLGSEPVRFRLGATIADSEDPTEDPTAPWPEKRERVELGMLELTGLAPAEKPGEPIVFDPMRLVDGVEPADDPILHARPHAYSISAERRSAPS